ncbi:Uncharacterised protein [Escherichia coli]|nr:Uncharacterised protein [Escherichia coli]
MKLIIFILIVLIIASVTYPDYPQKCKSAFSFADAIACGR